MSSESRVLSCNLLTQNSQLRIQHSIKPTSNLDDTDVERIGSLRRSS